MRQRGIFKRMALAGIGLGSLMVGLAVPASPAQAYSPNPKAWWVTQNASNCDKIVTNAPEDYYFLQSNGFGCFIEDGWDLYGTVMPFDSGGQNLYIDVMYGTPTSGVQPLAFFEFQAYGEHLQAWDYKSDNDSVYLWINGHSYCACLDNTDINLDLVDGQQYSIKITDDAAGTDVIASTAAFTLPHLVP
jgi:hypothetical protein